MCRLAIQDLLEEVVGGHAPRTAVVSKDPETSGVGEMLRSLGVQVLPFEDTATVARADLGITGAAAAIAATGSLVLCSDRAGGRSASLLPPLYVALVRSSNVLPDATALFGRMAELFPDGPPSQIVLSTGPSRSGDIEFTLTVGVHGPGRVWVGIID